MDGMVWPSPTVSACTLLAGSALDAVGLEAVDAEDGRWVQTRTQRSGNWGGSNVDGACLFNGVSSAAVSGKAPQTTQRCMRHGIRVLPGRREVERPSGLHAPTARRARAAGQ